MKKHECGGSLTPYRHVYKNEFGPHSVEEGIKCTKCKAIRVPMNETVYPHICFSLTGPDLLSLKENLESEGLDFGAFLVRLMV